MIARLGAALLGLLMMTHEGSASTDLKISILGFEDLEGWEQDDHQAALEVFRNTCRDMDGPEWSTLCAFASEAGDAKQFFELFFRPVVMDDGKDALFTGYFEPELNGSPVRTGRFQHPVYAMPPEAKRIRPWMTRREILTSGVMDGRGLEIAWVDDPVELFFLQVQGSGRIRYQDGRVVRVGYAGFNGHQYRSIGQELVRRGVYNIHQVSASVIQSWVRRNGQSGEELLYHNNSYVFFREVSEVPADKGPLGAMNRSITPMRSVAVDPAFVPLGAPVWVEKKGAGPLNRLMIAQDTGSAIKGAQRADLFIGTGDLAGEAAGRLKDPGRMVVLMPIQRAYAMLPEAVE